MSGQSSEDEMVKDIDSPPSSQSHVANLGILDQVNTEEDERESGGQSRDKVVCPKFCTDCDSETDKSESPRNPLTDAISVQYTFPIFTPVLTGQSGTQNPCLSPLSPDSGCPDLETECDNIPLHVPESCDAMDIPIDVNAVLVELPPPPPYTLVRGRRMRFLPQRMHFPPSANDGHYLSGQYLQQQHEPPQNETGKGCCPMLIIPENINVRWFIIAITFIALSCICVGIVLGALKGVSEFNGDDSLTISLLLIGVGIILMTVSGIAWRLTAKQGTETSLRSMLGFGSSVRPNSPALQSFRRMSTGPFSAYILRNSFGRSGCPAYYYEFQFRPPPPSYHASVIDYRIQSDRSAECAARTPPPNYRNIVGTCVDPLPLLNQIHHLPATNELSHSLTQPCAAPPSYRRRESLGRQPERPSVGHINTIFNENYSPGPNGDSNDAGFVNSCTSSSSKRCSGDNPEFLAHL